MGFAGWPIVAGACHVLSLLFGGNGKFFPQMMSLIGYTCIPLAIVMIPLIVLIFAMPTVTMDISQGSQAANKMVGNPLWILSSAISVIGSAWTAYVMAFSTKNGEKIAMGQALIVVGLLFVVNMAASFGSVILGML